MNRPARAFGRGTRNENGNEPRGMLPLMPFRLPSLCALSGSQSSQLKSQVYKQ